jgi:hypothetical protein
MDVPIVPTKQCGSIISASYILYLVAAHSAKSGVYKVKQDSISKPALLCRDYPLAFCDRLNHVVRMSLFSIISNVLSGHLGFREIKHFGLNTIEH